MNEQLGPFNPAFSSSPELEEKSLEEEAEKNERWSIKDFKGFIHFHSWAGSSCGKDQIADIREAINKKTGLKYIGFAEHVGWPKEEYWYEKIRTEFQDIDKINEENTAPKVFKGVEVNVFPDGSIDAPDDILNQSDIVVASIHYKNTDRPDQMTAESTVNRWITAMDNNPSINMLGHPLRELPKEEWGKVDWDKLCRHAAAKNVAIEVGIGDSAPSDLPREFFEALSRNNNLVSLAPDFHRLTDYLSKADLTPEQQSILEESANLKAKIAGATFNEGEALKGLKPGETALPEKERIIELRKNRAKLQEIEESGELAEIFSALTASEPLYVDIKNDRDEVETRKIDKKQLSIPMLMKYARRIYQIQNFIDRNKIINLWDEEKFSGWIESRKNNEQK
ncbi:MAG: hypothetical protein M1324_03840 [Patescibacteria group bacterium]|nr:hypothetical protein [Patescibacteria group bacterium]